MVEPTLLVGDLGGTTARFALAHLNAQGYGDLIAIPCRDFESAEDALDTYLERADAGAPDVIVLSVAGPLVGGTVRFVNIEWHLDKGRLESRFPSAKVALINDFGAIACSVPYLENADIEPVGRHTAADLGDRDINIAVVGPGTGLGVGGLIRRDGVLHPIAGEGGHVGFAPETRTQLAVLQQMRQRLDRVSNERVVSGPGIENIYQALQAIQKDGPVEATAAEIFRIAVDHEDEIASQAVHLFFEILGQAAGDIALALGAHDGVYIAGGIVPRYSGMLKLSRFRAAFENKGRHRSLMERIPTFLITHPQPGLMGASCIARAICNQPKDQAGIVH